jgi:hypothetical protein
MPVIESVDSPRGEEETRMQSGLGSVPSNDVRVGARGLCSVAVQRGSGPRPPLRFSRSDRVRGAVPGIRRFDGGKSGLPQPPVALPRCVDSSLGAFCV